MTKTETLTETEARALYLRFEYGRTVVGSEPDPSALELEYLADLDEEYVVITGEHIDQFTPAELEAWYDHGVADAVRDALGEHFAF
jgi:hypothetical protein